MKILMTGATGFIGKELGKKLVASGHRVLVITRSAQKALEELPFPAEVIEWNLVGEALPASAFKDVQGVVHLLGESINGRWSEDKKEKIIASRKQSSTNLLQNMPETVQVLVSASALGFYGDRQDELLTENSIPGHGFLPDVCAAWEEPFMHLMNTAKTRMVILRIGLVLSHQGGALKELVSLFQKNLGAPLGSGKQWMSWISRRDLVEIFFQALQDSRYDGVYNGVQPQPIQNKDFTKILCRALDVVQLPAAPGFVLKSLLGEMSSLLLDSQKAVSEKLLQRHFVFKDTDLENFLENELKDFKNGQRLFYAEQFIPAAIEKVFPFFADAQNLERITPPLLKFHVEKMSTAQIEKGTQIDYKLKIHGIPQGWRTLIETWNPPHQFVDLQLKGPYQKWHHTHDFQSFAGGTLISDTVRFKLPFGYFGRLAAGALVESDVDRIFSYRRHIIAEQKF